jgi:hypothetical protein
MTWMQAYVTFGIPAIALAMAFAALWLTRRDRRRLDQKADAAE